MKTLISFLQNVIIYTFLNISYMIMLHRNISRKSAVQSNAQVQALIESGEIDASDQEKIRRIQKGIERGIVDEHEMALYQLRRTLDGFSL